MRNKRRHNNIKVLQEKLQDLAINKDSLNEDKNSKEMSGLQRSLGHSTVGYGSKEDVMKEVLLIVKPVKKKGIKKDELINTRRLLTM
jgi:hypothetical protein